MEIIHSYTRKEAVADGFQVRIPDDIRTEAGILFPVFVTRSVWDKYLKAPVEMKHQDLEGRTWDMLYMLRIRAARNNSSSLSFQVIFQMPDKGNWEKNEKVMGRRTFREVTLNAVVGPYDIDDLSPAITIMKPGED